MTKRWLEERWHLIEAMKNGKILQYKEITGWRDIGENEQINFASPLDCYRIKPEPREWYKILNNDNSRMTKTNFNSYEEAQKSLEMIINPLRKDYAKNFQIIKVREVLDDGN